MRGQVLIADRSAAVRTALGAALLGDGHLVMQAEDATAALACIDRVPMDLLVADIELDGLSCLELVELVRES